MSTSEHAPAAPVAIPEAGQTSEAGVNELVAEFERYDFRNDQEFRAGLPSVIKSVKGRGASAADIDDVIARAQWFYFTRKRQSQVPFSAYLEHRTGETESVPMGSSAPSGSSPSAPPAHFAPSSGPSRPPPQDPIKVAHGAHGLAPPSSDPPPFSSRPSTPPAGFDTDGEGGITVERVCSSIPASRATTPPPRDPTPQARPSLATAGRVPSTGGSALPTPGLTESSEPSTPDASAQAGARIENRVAVAAEMAVPAGAEAEAEADTAAETDAPGPIETTAPGPDGPQLPFDEVVRLISTGRAGEVPHHEVPEGLNEAPASEAKLTARLKPWERAAQSQNETAEQSSAEEAATEAPAQATQAAAQPQPVQ